jgi:anti-sigma B factor antagonist
VDLNETSEGAVKVIAVRGRLDGSTAQVLGERLASTLGPASPKLLLELSQLEYISSAGFRVLLIAAKRANESNGQIALSGIAGHVRQLFEVGGFVKLFRIFGTRDEGVSALR